MEETKYSKLASQVIKDNYRKGRFPDFCFDDQSAFKTEIGGHKVLFRLNDCPECKEKSLLRLGKKLGPECIHISIVCVNCDYKDEDVMD